MCGRTDGLPAWDGRLGEGALKMALCAFQQRYLFGWAVLDVELRRKARERLRPTIPEVGGANKLKMLLWIA